MFDDWDDLELPAKDRTMQVQRDTAALFITAGFETTAFTIETALYHVLSNPNILAKLKAEIKPVLTNTAKDDPEALPKWKDLEKLPYLSAIISESLRMSLGVSSRLARYNSKTDLVYIDWIIPKNAHVSMTQRDISYNSNIFPSPTTFDPERWLKGEESRELKEKYLVSFSKGARRCIGMNLAYAELYITLATMFGQFDLELYDTTRKEVDPKTDYFVPKPDSLKGVRVLVK
jgi:cytochrome P450